MKKITFCAMLVLIAAATGYSQAKTGGKSISARANPIIFAVIDGGKTLEPVGAIKNGEIVETVGGSADEKDLTAFVNNYYKPKTSYELIFGGVKSGTVTVKNSNVKTECGKNTASVATLSKVRLISPLMALATDDAAAKTGAGMRRMPTPAEKSEIESLVRAEYAKQKIPASATKILHYQNLTAVDVDDDGKAELIGSYWVAKGAKERDLLFFIAGKGADGKYSFGYSEFKKLTPEDIMSGANLKTIESGTYNEMLLDTFAYGGDSTAKIFTTIPGLEGSGFNVYARKDGKWTRVFEGSNYHCAF